MNLFSLLCLIQFRLLGQVLRKPFQAGLVLLSFPFGAEVTYGQYPVHDGGMAHQNQETLTRHAFEQFVERHAILDFTREMMRGLPDSKFEWRDAVEHALAVETVLSETDVLGYTRGDLRLLVEEAYPGFAPVADWAIQQEGRARQVIGTHRAILLSIAEDQLRWNAQQGRLLRLKNRIDGVGESWGSVVTPLLPDVAPRQKLMELRANVRAVAQRETLLLREAMLARSLLYNLQNTTGPDAKARQLALTERAIGIASP
ncbi:hypothetical protein BSZ35_17890 [Salinibacter sp. 10B]|uniref:hypothetical protein n=1 Tax=Salinibacter sp. 10B TaxID=1923971 RepID=UPI000CF4C4B1|nr:hypothetical protein [Salinibacter sp. 10B]PQJ26806.1 hypothetical protein BSZ35_17890 [Salinibacter sp. 10B]